MASNFLKNSQEFIINVLKLFDFLRIEKSIIFAPKLVQNQLLLIKLWSNFPSKLQKQPIFP